MPIAISMISPGSSPVVWGSMTHIPFNTGVVHDLIDVVRGHTRLDLSCSDIQNLPR